MDLYVRCSLFGCAIPGDDLADFTLALIRWNRRHLALNVILKSAVLVPVELVNGRHQRAVWCRHSFDGKTRRRRREHGAG